jgi:succinate dehydrogenase / fumarate reductase, cytochrome b subunit
MAKTLTLYQTTIGKKVAMALSGIVLIGFVLVHLLGNLQVYMGPEQLNAYGKFLHSKPALIWAFRLIMLAAVLVHVVSAVSLVIQGYQARPRGYVREKAVASTYASRTMKWGGLLLVMFVIYHLLHFTVGTVHPTAANFDSTQVYANFIIGFQSPIVSGFYIIAMCFLALHLYHGIWSLFQTLGLSNERRSQRLRQVAAAITAVVFLGNVSFPISVLAGFLRLQQ